MTGGLKQLGQADGQINKTTVAHYPGNTKSTICFNVGCNIEGTKEVVQF